MDFHRGELAVQERVGVRQQAAKIGGSIHGAVPPAAGVFLEQRRFVVLATADPDGRCRRRMTVVTAAVATTLSPSRGDAVRTT